MNDTRPIIIAVFGLSPREERILQTICFISQTRVRTYELMPNSGGVEPDVAILDGHDPQAVANWQEFSSTRPMLPLVIVGDAVKTERPGLRIDRPLLATRLLDVFDKIEFSNENPAFANSQTKQTKARQETTAPHPATQARTASRSALVVDDSLPIRVQMQKELELFVGQIDLAENGEQALELIANNTYNIIFLDVVLPGMDGYQICKTIKRDKRTKDVPVIMLTGKASPFDRVRGKLAGCDNYLIKPVDLPTFKEVVKRSLSRGETE